jgi:hypothetical protein
VLAFDVGTTYSGVSYSILDPDEIPEIKGVTRFPAQEKVGGDSKIPSILYYNQQGQLCAAGAEALQEQVIEQADEEKWIKLEWWKLHLRPKDLPSSHVNDSDIPQLPQNRSAVEVLGDFLKYLYECARSYIQDTHGKDLWKSIENHIQFVLTHPNGWEGAQQSQIRRAAVLAGLIHDDQDGQSHLQFVTEGEASLHYCLRSGLTSNAVEKGLIVVDAGGGTIDLSAYYMLTPKPATFEEIAAAECIFQGSVFVSRRAGDLLREKLRGSKFGNEEDIALMTSCFDKTTKHSFRKPDEPSYIKFGTMRDKDLAFNIRSGQLKLLGSEVETLFEPSAQEIINAIEKQRRAAGKTISSIFLVGGFAASNWLFSRLESYLLPRGIQFCRPDGHANKAVADGAVAFYLDHVVSVRVARFTYGTKCSVLYNPLDPQHVARSATMYTHPSGLQYVPKAFDGILVKGTQVSEDKEFSSSFSRTPLDISQCESVDVDITCYRGDMQLCRWLDADPNMFSTLCTVTADTSQLAYSLQPLRGIGGIEYYHLEFDVVLQFGLTELKAQISWMEEGEEKRCPAQVVYDVV